MTFALLVTLVAVLVLLAWLWIEHLAHRRESFIRNAALPKGLFERLQKRHPTLSAKDCQLVAKGLRQFFLAYLKSGRQFVAMPSQVVDDLWHEFILYTKNYDQYCRRAFGGFLHHTPAILLSRSKRNNTGLRRCWWHACKEENINPRSALRLPLLFALDAKLLIPGGFRYVPDCTFKRERGDGDGPGSSHCGGDFSDPSHDGGLDGFDDAGSVDGGGAGSDGCGGDGGD